MTQVIESLSTLQLVRKNLKGTVGFVPTMGALHAGHGKLLEQARAENDYVILSVFVNPTQFNNKDDLAKYPKTLESDLEIAKKFNVDYVWVPTYSQLYPDEYTYKVSENNLSTRFCGAHRPGHFDGVLTVVMKLFNLAQPTRAYFGEKDFQQLSLIQGMAKSFFLNPEIVPVPTVREESGLAMSSRNVHLSAEEKHKAPLLYKTIKNAKTPEEAAQKLTDLGFKVDYVEDLGNRRLAAAFLGTTRLIDNVEL